MHNNNVRCHLEWLLSNTPSAMDPRRSYKIPQMSDSPLSHCQYNVWMSSLAKPTPQAGHLRWREAIRSFRQVLQKATLMSMLQDTRRVQPTYCAYTW